MHGKSNIRCIRDPQFPNEIFRGGGGGREGGGEGGGEGEGG